MEAAAYAMHREPRATFAVADMCHETIAYRKAMAAASARLLRAIKGEPEPVKPRTLIQALINHPRKRRSKYIPVADRPECTMPKAVRDIIARTAEAFSIPVDQMTSKSRQREAVMARRVAIRLLRDRLREDGKPRLSLPTIARYLCRDHSTICYALDNFEDTYKRVPEVAAIYDRLSANAA